MAQPSLTGGCNFTGFLTYLLKENTMKSYLVLLFSGAALLAGNALAQDTMKKDEMGKGAMSASGSMAKESMGKDEMKKDQMSKSHAKKPEKKGGMSKDDSTMGKDNMKQ